MSIVGKISFALLFATLLSCGAVPEVRPAAPMAVVSQPADVTRRELSVVLYPYVPAKGELFADVKQQFEARNPEIQLTIVDLEDNYYRDCEKDSLQQTRANVYELDAVFLADMVESGRIQPLPGALMPKPNEFLTVADGRAGFDGRIYGSPHWVCTNFLFYPTSDPAFGGVRTLKDLERTIGANHPKGRGFSSPLSGSSTLGERYLGLEVSRYGQPAAVWSHLAELDPAAKKDILRLAHLCDAGDCHADHPDDYLPSQFVLRKSRAYGGYAESLFYALQRSASCTSDDKCIQPNEIRVGEFPLSDRSYRPVAWVDMFAVDTACQGQCLEDATALIRFLNSEDTLLGELIHRDSRPPRYLLPARASLYRNQTLLADAPLYPKLRALVEPAESPTALNLNGQLRAVGKVIDKVLTREKQ